MISRIAMNRKLPAATIPGKMLICHPDQNQNSSVKKVAPAKIAQRNGQTGLPGFFGVNFNRKRIAIGRQFADG